MRAAFKELSFRPLNIRTTIPLGCRQLEGISAPASQQANLEHRNVACARDDVINKAKERIETNLTHLIWHVPVLLTTLLISVVYFIQLHGIKNVIQYLTKGEGHLSGTVC